MQPVGIRSGEFEIALAKNLFGLASLIGVESFDQYAVNDLWKRHRCLPLAEDEAQYDLAVGES